MEETKQQEVPKYNRNKKYTWDPKAEFTITGWEFHVLYNNLAGFINGEITPANILRVADAFAICQQKLMTLVEEDVIQEQEAPKLEKASNVVEFPKPEDTQTTEL